MKEQIISVLKESPGILGKEIAKKLDLPKKEVNSFLYKNTDVFGQGSDWKWYLSNDHYLLELSVSGQRWIDEDSFEYDFTRAGCLLSSSNNKCVIKFPSKCKILLITGARLIALANQAAHKGKDIELDFSDCNEVMSYLNRLGFFDHLNKGVYVLPERPKKSRARQYKGNSRSLVEIASIDINNFDQNLPRYLTDIIVENSSEEYRTSVFTIFSELIGNVKEHSETPFPGFAALQVYKGGKRPHIQTVISDSGLGIAQTLLSSLKEYYPDVFQELSSNSTTREISLVKKTLTEGGLSRFGSKEARGLGLNAARSQATKLDATIIVRQLNYELKLIYKNGKLKESPIKTGLSEINGTQVCFDFYLN